MGIGFFDMEVLRLFRLPVLPEEEQARQARALHFVVLSLLLVTDTQFFVFFFLLPQNWLRWLAILLTINCTAPSLLLLNHRGHTRLGRALLMAELWLLGTVLALTAGGIRSTAILMYAVCVFAAGLLFGSRGGVIAGVGFALTSLGFVLLERANLLPESAVTHTILSIWVVVAFCLEFIAIFQFMANRSIRTAWLRAQQAEADLRRANAELEARVKERTADLEKVNKELEAFSYSVSHDLRRPLRSMGGFAELLMLKHAPELPKAAQELVTRIKTSADQMNHLIDTLLRLSRIDRQPLKPRPVNLTTLARQTIDELSAAEPPERMKDIRIASLPDCMGDPDLLRQVFINLLSNALKFVRGRPTPVIEVGFETQEGKTVYFVRDNGAGFDMRFADKLFGVFQRLHSEEQFKGNGLGLSIVKRIIQRHGGTVWAKSALQQGATFYFTLPQATT